MRVVVVSVIVAFCSFLLAPGAPSSSAPPQVRVRKNVNSLSDAELSSLKRGIAVMKERSKKDPNDPTGWRYQAAIHATFVTPVHKHWNQCQHDNKFFLSWHRMYLYFFEKILREASGDPNLTLPYWDYTDKKSRSLPLAFIKPASEQNPLYESQRGDHVNDGAELKPEAVQTGNAMGKIPFYDPASEIGDYGFSTSLELIPHRAVHSAVGGLMADACTAALDPVFFLHHANVDRLWGEWLALDQGRSNPADKVWLKDQKFTFYDENKNEITMSGEQIVDSSRQLGYCYDTECGAHPNVSANRAHHRSPESERSTLLVVNSTEQTPVRLAERQTTISLSIAPGDINKLLESATFSPEQSARPAGLILDDLTANSGIEGYFEIYLDLPEDVQPDPKRPEFIGLLSFFGVEHEMHEGKHARRTFPVNLMRFHFMKHPADSHAFRLTFFRRGMEHPDNKEVPKFKGTPSINSIKIAVRIRQRR